MVKTKLNCSADY